MVSWSLRGSVVGRIHLATEHPCDGLGLESGAKQRIIYARSRPLVEWLTLTPQRPLQAPLQGLRIVEVTLFSDLAPGFLGGHRFDTASFQFGE